ncbi:MAG: hypothetical protein ACKVZJ_04240 [Phycisphaerales bacterium]
MARKAAMKAQVRDTTKPGEDAGHSARVFAAKTPERFMVFIPSTDPRVTSCEAWKSLMQFREELLTNPRTDPGETGWWSRWVGTVLRYIVGQDERWGRGYYGPNHMPFVGDMPGYHPFEQQNAARPVESVRRDLHRLFEPKKKRFVSLEGDDTRTVFFPPYATIVHFYSAAVVDWSAPFPSIAERGHLIEWVESWLDVITYTEATGHYPWEAESKAASAAVFCESDFVAERDWLGAKARGFEENGKGDGGSACSPMPAELVHPASVFPSDASDGDLRPGNWFRHKHGIPLERLNKQWQDGKMPSSKKLKRVRWYSLQEVMAANPEDFMAD